MLKIDLGGYQLSYQVCGQGRVILFIQGVGVYGAGWAPQTGHFSNSYRCITFDNRGLGSSSSVDQGFTVDNLARDAIAIMDASGVERAHVVGHSLGGMIALQLALLVKNRVRSLSLICSFANGRRVAPLTWRMIWLGMRTQIGTRAMRQRGFLRLIHAPGAAIESADMSRMQELFGHDLSAQPPVANLQLRAMRRTDLTERLSELAGIPTLVLSARHDPIAPPALGKSISDGIAGARLEVVEDASHGLPITHADLTNQFLAGHLHNLE